MATKTKLKTIDLKGKQYVQVDTRVEYFNATYKNGRITTIPTFNDNTVYFKATIIPDIDKPERKFTGHSFGILGKEKALEKLETVAVGRALAFMGIGIVEGIASADEINNFNNNQKYDNSPNPKTCPTCGTKTLPSKYPNGKDYCPQCRTGVEPDQEKTGYHKKLEGALDLQEIQDKLDATEKVPTFDNQLIKG